MFIALASKLLIWSPESDDATGYEYAAYLIYKFVFRMNSSTFARNEMRETRQIQLQLRNCDRFGADFTLESINEEERQYPLAFR